MLSSYSGHVLYSWRSQGAETKRKRNPDLSGRCLGGCIGHVIRDWWAASGSQTVTGAAIPVAPLLLAAVTGTEGSNYDPAFHLRMLPSINLLSATSIAAVATPASLSASAISSSPLLLAWLLVPHGVASGRQGINQKQC